MPDLEPFVSPVDGTVVTGRAALREHDKRNGVTNVADYKNEWENRGTERAAFYSGDQKYDRERRREAIIRAVEKHERRR